MEQIVIRDSVHGDILLEDECVQQIVASREFQRLHRIFQWSPGGQMAFPSATHTRFTHCLGVYYIVCKIMKEPVFLKAYVDKPKLVKMVKLAGLLHDLGHGPFSHTFEQTNYVTKSKIKHEAYSTLLISHPNSQIFQVLQRHGFSGDEINDICAMIEGKYSKDPILASLVSSQLDADRIDYLLRDGRYSGTDYGGLDTQWIIRHMGIDSNSNTIYYSDRALYAVQSFLTGRYYMYRQVYYHPNSIGYDYTFRLWFMRLYDLYHQHYAFKCTSEIDLLEELLCASEISYDHYVQLDDYQFTMLFRKTEKEDDLILKTLSSCLLNNNILKATDEKDVSDYKRHIADRFGEENIKYFYMCATPPHVDFYRNDEKPIYIMRKSKEKLQLQPLDDFFELKVKKMFANPKISFTIKEV